MNERSQEMTNMKQADRLHELKSIEMDQRVMDLARAEQECRDAVTMATKEYNLALARERKSKEDAEKQKELEDNLTEISNHVNGDMLTENPAVAQSAFGSHRVIPDRWKGMSPFEVKQVLNTQRQQAEENNVGLFYCFFIVFFLFSIQNEIPCDMIFFFSVIFNFKFHPEVDS